MSLRECALEKDCVQVHVHSWGTALTATASISIAPNQLSRSTGQR